MSKRVEMVGRVFGSLTVLKEAGYSSAKFPKLKYTCQCECGVVKDIVGEQLRHEIRSCGCKRNSPRADSIVGKRFSRLTVSSEVRGGLKTMCECVCDCGNKTQVARGALITGNTSSCGCSRRGKDRSHLRSKGCSRKGDSGQATYTTWRGMKERCLNANHPKYPNYGGRGITIDPRWEGFSNFLEDMGERPRGKTLDRINNDLGYFKGNCRWADPIQQANNRRPRSK